MKVKQSDRVEAVVGCNLPFLHYYQHVTKIHLGAVKKKLIFIIHFFTAPYAVNDIELHVLILNDGLLSFISGARHVGIYR